jgi:hypothetical protein
MPENQKYQWWEINIPVQAVRQGEGEFFLPIPFYFYSGPQ